MPRMSVCVEFSFVLNYLKILKTKHEEKEALVNILVRKIPV